jgi:hypothetical protein
VDELASHTEYDSRDTPPVWLPLPPAPDIPSKREMTCAELTAQELIIERGKQTFVEVGAALLDIRDRRGYRFEYATFEEYCRKRWDFGRVYAHRLIEAAEITANLLPMGNIAGKLDLSDPATWPEGVKLPENERQTRPLAGLEPEQQREAWKRAIETAPNGKITSAHVESVVEQFKAPKARVNWSEYATSASDDEAQIIKWIIDLYNAGEPFDLDVTFSTGIVWRGLPEPRLKGDLHPSGAGVSRMDARHLRFKDGSLRSIFFDPPHLPKDPTREDGKLGIMEQRFSGYKSVPELWRMYADALREFHRVLAPGA